MPHYACIGIQADRRPLMAIRVHAAAPDLAEEIAWRIFGRVPGVEAVEVYLGVQRVGRAGQTDRAAA